MRNYGLGRLYSLLLLLFTSTLTFSQATLPLSRTTWDGAAPVGWTDSGTGSYTTTFACTGSNMGRMDDAAGADDYYEVFFTGTPDQLDFALKSASMSATSVVTLEESPDGAAWTTIDTYGPGGATAITNCANINIALNGTTRYVRWTYTKDGGNAGLDDVSISAVACTDPTTAATSLTFPSTSYTSMDISWANGDGSNRLVVMSTSPVTAAPADGTPYTASTVFGSGDDIGTSEFVVYNGTGNTVSVSGLTENTTYYITVFEYNDPGQCYLTTSTLTGNETTLTVVPTELRFASNPAGCIEENSTFSVTVCATDASGNVASTYTGTITVSVASGTGNLSGTLSVSASSGCASFSDLSIDATDTYTLTASDGSLTNGTSGSFYVAPAGSCVVTSTWAGLIINEASNGPSGSKEYYEFVVAGECGASVDIRGWILDDNNGTFSTAASYPTGSGIAQGHFRLTTDAQWASIPVGSVIVVYNADDRNSALPADDVSDANNDSLYVIPHTNSTLFETCGSLPTANGAGDSTYTPCTYSAPAASAWTSSLGLANSGDAIQVRSPDGAYWHGVSFGGSSITGGPDDLKLSTTTSGGNVLYFNGGDYKLNANWSEGTAGTADETPGQPNNAANLAWLRTIRDPLAPVCVIYPPLSVAYFSMDVSLFESSNVLIAWDIIVEEEKGQFLIQRSSDGKAFETIGKTVHQESKSKYEFVDLDVASGKHFYRIVFESDEGKRYHSPIQHVNVAAFGLQELFPNPTEDVVNVRFRGDAGDELVTIHVTDMLGKQVLQRTVNAAGSKEQVVQLDVEALPKGTYTVIISANGYLDYKKLSIR